MKSTSPPVGVYARPVATPGTAVRSAASCQKRWRPRASRTASSSRATGADTSPAASRVAVFRSRAPAGGRARGGLPRQRPELALEVADARLARVLPDDRAKELVGDLDLVL